MDASGYRSEFPILEEKTYLNSCSLCALSTRVKAAVGDHLDTWDARGASAWYDRWLAVLDDTRERFARLIGASVDEVAILPNVSSALAGIASGLDYDQRDEIVSTELDFPTLARTWQARDDARVRFVESPDGIHVPPKRIEEAMGPDTAALATSQVFFTTGAVQDVKRLSKRAEEVGALSIVDAYQATGQIPTDVDEIGCDVLVTGGLKWLLGGTGVCYLYVDSDAQQRLDPQVAGWFGDREQFAFDTTTFRPREGARRFEMGTPSLPSVHAGRAGLEIVEEVGPGAIRERQTELTRDLVERFADCGFELCTPQDPADHAGIVMVDLPDPGATVQRLAKQGIIVDHRPGRLRVSPYFYNTLEETAQIVEAVDEIAPVSAS